MIKDEFSASLLQSSDTDHWSDTHDPSEIIIIWWFAAQETFLIIINVEISYIFIFDDRRERSTAFIRNITFKHYLACTKFHLNFIKTYIWSLFSTMRLCLNMKLGHPVWPSILAPTSCFSVKSNVQNPTNHVKNMMCPVFSIQSPPLQKTWDLTAATQKEEHVTTS